MAHALAAECMHYHFNDIKALIALTSDALTESVCINMNMLTWKRYIMALMEFVDAKIFRW